MYLSDIQTLAVICELLLAQLALFLELCELGLLREDFLFALLYARHVVSCVVAFQQEVLNQCFTVNM